MSILDFINGRKYKAKLNKLEEEIALLKKQHSIEVINLNQRTKEEIDKFKNELQCIQEKNNTLEFEIK